MLSVLSTEACPAGSGWMETYGGDFRLVFCSTGEKLLKVNQVKGENMKTKNIHFAESDHLVVELLGHTVGLVMVQE